MTSLDFRHRIVAEARSWIATPYHHQASLKGVGCDCLGLVRGVWRALIGPEPEATGAYSPDWAEALGIERLAVAAGRHMTAVPVTAAGCGDVVLFRWRDELPAKHAAILTGEGTFIHAYSGAAVCESPYGSWWRKHAAFAFAFPEPNTPG
jgi:NlpC/P60 family putative phage cell wall peptidase